MFFISFEFQIQETAMTSNVSSPESAPTVRAWTFCLLKMSSNAQKAASKIAIVPGSVSFLIQIFVKPFQAAKTLTKPHAQIASADKENVKTQFLLVLFKVIKDYPKVFLSAQNKGCHFSNSFSIPLCILQSFLFQPVCLSFSLSSLCINIFPSFFLSDLLLLFR